MQSIDFGPYSLLNLLLSRDSTTHNGLDSPPQILSQEQTCLQANLIEAKKVNVTRSRGQSSIVSVTFQFISIFSFSSLHVCFSQVSMLDSCSVHLLLVLMLHRILISDSFPFIEQILLGQWASIFHIGLFSNLVANKANMLRKLHAYQCDAVTPRPFPSVPRAKELVIISL